MPSVDGRLEIQAGVNPDAGTPSWSAMQDPLLCKWFSEDVGEEVAL